MLDFKNYFSPAVFFCGDNAVMLSTMRDTTSTALWAELSREGIPQINGWTENHTCGEKLSPRKLFQASCNINFLNKTQPLSHTILDGFFFFCCPE